MTDFAGTIDSKLSDLLGGHDPRPKGTSVTAYSALPAPNQNAAELETFGLLAFIDAGALYGSVETRQNARTSPEDFPGYLAHDLGSDWFERIILNPARLDFGNILSSQVRNVEVVNNYRDAAQQWTALNDLTGGEVSTTSVPSLPTTLNALQAVTIQVNVALDGAPVIDGDLEFVFTVVTLLLPVTGTRIILFPFQPEAPVIEVLRSHSEVLTHADGSEQRIGLRKAPRQIIEYRVFQDGDNERDRLNAMLYDWQDKVFGVPIWWEARYLTSAITAPTDTIQVDTRYGDFRVGGLVALFNTFSDFEILEIQSMTDSQLVFTSQVQTSRQPNDIVVMPVRTAYAEGDIGQSRYPIGPTVTNLRFTTLDNEDLADVSTFGTYNGKVLIDRANIIDGNTVPEGFLRRIEVLDPKTGVPAQLSPWAKSKPRIQLGLNGHSLKETWEIRQLFHALGGQLTSFYLGTGRNEIIPTTDIVDTATSFQIEFLDFTKFYEAAPVAPRGHIQITRTNGTKSQHQITAAQLITPGLVEQLTVTPAITPALPLSQLSRIEFLTLARLRGDDVAVTHIRVGESAYRVGTIGVPA